MSAEELTPLFTQALQRTISALIENTESRIEQFDQEDIDNLVDALNWEKNDDIFNSNTIRGQGSLNKSAILKFVRQAYPEYPAAHADIRDAIVGANALVVNSQKAAAKKSERKKQIAAMLEGGDFLSVEEAARQYKMLGNVQKKQALLNTLGYLQTYHFALNQKQAINPGAPTETKDLGAIRIGRVEVKNVVDSIRDILNEEVTEIFQSLKILSDSLNQFFAGGLQNDELADSAIGNADNISSKEILQTDN